MGVAVFGHGRLADHLRANVASAVPSSIIIPAIDGTAVAVHELDDARIASLFEEPMRAVIQSCQEAFQSGSQRIVIVVPTTAMSGGARYAATAALAEAARILVKSAARQWGHDRVTVNAVAVEPRWFGIDPSIAGPVSIAAPALFDDAITERVHDGDMPPTWLEGEVTLDPVPLVAWLCSESAGTTTGQTLVCDGGQWM